MSAITPLLGTDGVSTANSMTKVNANFDSLNADKIETSVLDTDTALTANSDLNVPSQRAVKAYVDTGGNVNASETTKGIAEEATDAEITAGTATGGTGAKLFVTPAKLSALFVGQMFHHAGISTPPAGFLKADGSAVSRTTYANLFTAIGTTYGSGDGSTTFNLPASVFNTGLWTYDATSKKTQGAATSISQAHVITFSNSVLVMGIAVAIGGNPVITNVQYGGVAMTQIGTGFSRVPNVIKWYYQINPAIGTANITASWTGSASANLIAVSYYGMGNGIYVDYQTTGTANSTTLTQTTTSALPSLSIALFFSTNVSATVPTFNANATSRNTQVSSNAHNAIIGELVSTALTVQATFPSSDIDGAIVSFKPVMGSNLIFEVIKF